MRNGSLIVFLAATMLSACARRVPEPAITTPGVPHVSWVIMSGDRDNPDREFVCQSEPRTDCVVPASRPDSRVLSDVHIYYHGAGAETRYEGSIQIGFFDGSPAAHTVRTNMLVKKTESIMNQSVSDIGSVTGHWAQPGFIPPP